MSPADPMPVSSRAAAPLLEARALAIAGRLSPLDISFAAGALLGVTATFASLLRKRREISQLRRQLERAEREKLSAAPAVAAADIQISAHP